VRHLRRLDLPRSVLGALSSYRAALDSLLKLEQRESKPDVGKVIETAWRTRRRSNAMKSVELALRAMASGIERCMYCEDSHGCDVEHFRTEGAPPGWDLLMAEPAVDLRGLQPSEELRLRPRDP